MTNEELITFEKAVFDGACRCDRCFAGYVCWIVYTRTRFGDSSRITEEINEDRLADDVLVFAETKAFLTKTGQQGRRFRLPLPVVSPNFSM